MLASLVVLDSFRGFSNCSPSVPDTSNAVVEEVDVEKRNIGGRREGKLRLNHTEKSKRAFHHLRDSNEHLHNLHLSRQAVSNARRASTDNAGIIEVGEN